MTWTRLRKGAGAKATTWPDHRRVASPRLRWYNAMLDPSIRGGAVPASDYPDDLAAGGALERPTAEHPPNLVSSLCVDGFHRPLLDVDIPYVEFGDYADDLSDLLCAHLIICESAGGNTHVYVPDPVYTWSQYEVILQSLAAVEWLEDAYVGHCIERRQSLLRLPGVPKLWFVEPPLVDGYVVDAVPRSAAWTRRPVQRRRFDHVTTV